MELLYGYFTIIILAILLQSCKSQHEDIPYASVANICQKCMCLTMDEKNGDRVQHVLNCYSRNFHHILPRWPTEFETNNETDREIIVTFSGNSIPLLQQIPATSARLSFSCKHCGIKDIQVPTFVDVPNVFRIDLSWNYLNEDILSPDIFRGPYNVHAYEPIGLEELDLSHNKIRSLDRKLFEHTPHLKKINLSHNQFFDMDTSTTSSLQGLPNLELIDLSYNELRSLPPNMFESLPLKELSLRGNAFTVIPDCLQHLSSSLQYLNLGRNSFKIINESSLSQLTRLTHLDLSDMDELKEIELEAIAPLTNLKVFTCRNNPDLQRLDIGSLINATDLESLDISNCDLTTFYSYIEKPFDINPFSWKNLRYLNFQGNRWNCDCSLVKSLRNYKSKLIQSETPIRCSSPYHLAGVFIHQVDEETICKVPVARKLKIPIHDPPLFLRPKSIVLSVVSIVVVVALGLVAGFAIAVMKKKLKTTELAFTAPIRYTIVKDNPAE